MMSRAGYQITFSLLILCVVFFSSCQTDISTVDLFQPEKLPSESAKNVEVIYSDSGKVKVKLFGPQLDRYEVPVKLFRMTEGVYLEFYDDSAKVKSWLRADYGVSYEAEEKMEAKRNVIVMNEKGEKLETEHLTWSRKEGMIFTDDTVRITRKDEIVVADGIRASEDFSEYTLGPTIGTYYIDALPGDSTPKKDE